MQYKMSYVAKEPEAHGRDFTDHKTIRLLTSVRTVKYFVQNLMIYKQLKGKGKGFPYSLPSVGPGA